MTRSLVDRRAALKERHHDAIVAAAAALIDERGDARFSVDDLAERADVSRRTVFNRFSSLDDVVMTVCTDKLQVLIDDVRSRTEDAPAGSRDRGALFDDLARALADAPIPAAVAFFARALGTLDERDPRYRRLVDEAFARTSDQLTDDLVRSGADLDPLDVELLVGSLMNGAAIIARRWIESTGAALDAASLAEWDALLARLVASVRGGYLPDRRDAGRSEQRPRR